MKVYVVNMSIDMPGAWLMLMTADCVITMNSRILQSPAFPDGMQMTVSPTRKATDRLTHDDLFPLLNAVLCFLSFQQTHYLTWEVGIKYTILFDGYNVSMH